VNLRGFKIVNLGYPEEPTDAANKQFVLDTAGNVPAHLMVTLIGDVLGGGALASPIITAFKPDPVFTGKAVTIPLGNRAERPEAFIAGMIRLNEVDYPVY